MSVKWLQKWKLRNNSLLHEEQEGEKEQAVQPNERIIVERQERNSCHTVQLNHEAESSKDATLQDFAFNSTAQMKTSSVILGTANVDISNEEEEVTSKSILTKEERACEEHFVTHHKQEADGRFVVRLPFKNNIEQLDESKILAEQRLHSLERKFQVNPTLKKGYSQCMDEYLRLSHMSLLENNDSTGCNLPHHAILRKDSITHKLRVVYDGSMKTTTIETLMKGPTI
ncbi:hypothetical protein Trydic_g5425 [Trypoxylus dichotomus]